MVGSQVSSVATLEPLPARCLPPLWVNRRTLLFRQPCSKSIHLWLGATSVTRPTISVSWFLATVQPSVGSVRPAVTTRPIQPLLLRHGIVAISIHLDRAAPTTS